MIEKFKIFLILPKLVDRGGQVNVTWVIDRRLEKNALKKIEAQAAVTPEEFFWLCLNHLSKNPSSQKEKDHLICFLSFISIKVAEKLKFGLYQHQTGGIKSESFLVDLYQIALEVILEPVNFFRDFKTNYNTKTAGIKKIENYAYGKIRGKVIDRLRLIPGMKTIWRTNLGLLVKVSEKQIEDALRNRGETELTIQLYTLAVKCFLEVKNAGLINSSAVADRDFESVAKLYKQRGNILLKEIAFSLEITGDLVNNWLNKTGESVRNYIDKKKLSSATPISRENDAVTIEDNLVDRLASLRQQPEYLELTTQQENIKEYLFEKIIILSQDSNVILFCLYGLELKQTEIAEDLVVNQSTIARRHRQIVTQLIEQTIQEIPVFLNIHTEKNKINNFSSLDLKYVKDCTKSIIEEYYFTWLKQKIKLELLDAYLNNYEKTSNLVTSYIAKIHGEVSIYISEINQLIIEQKLNECLGEVKYHYWQFDLKQLIINLIQDSSIDLKTLQPNSEKLIKSVAAIVESQFSLNFNDSPHMIQALRLKVTEWRNKYMY